MEPLPPPPSRLRKPGQPLETPGASSLNAKLQSSSESLNQSNKSQQSVPLMAPVAQRVTTSTSHSSVAGLASPLPAASPASLGSQFSPPVSRHATANTGTLPLSVLTSPAESTSPSGASSPYLSGPRRTVKETHYARKYYDGSRKLINEYHVMKELGRGVHGKVKRALNTDTNEQVAIKIIPRFSKKRRLGKLTAQNNDSTKTMREIAILKKIRHPNVVALLEVIDDPELQKIYMVLEYVELGEICWRKKGLPHICDHERKRVCPYVNAGDRTDDDEALRIQRRQEHMGDLSRIKQEEDRVVQMNQGNQGNFWQSPYKPSTDQDHDLIAPDIDDNDDNVSVPMSRNISINDFAAFEHGLSLGGYAFPSSVAASRATSRAPSRAPSSSSLVQHYDSGIMKTTKIPEEPVVAKSVVYDLHDESDRASSRAYRDSTMSRAGSVLSRFSENDFEPGLVSHDPFADDFSYVPCFTYDRARSTFRDTVLGLEYLHYQGVVHRDIKPSNLLWTAEKRVKISDFGVSYFGRPIREGEDDSTVSESEATDFDDDRELSKTVGTPAFFAPELCYTDPDVEQYKVSEQIDVWSLGVTLYCLIYARIPFLAEDEYQMFKKIATEEPYLSDVRLAPVDPSTSPQTSSLFQRINKAPYRDDNDLTYEKVDPDLRDLLSRMLTKDPEKRIRLREIKRHPWVTHNIADVPAWLEETDPSRPCDGRRIQVDDKELDDAVVPLTFFERARSVVKKAVGKVMHPLGGGERDSSRLRRRAPSSNAGSSTDLTRAALPGSVLPRDSRRRSLRPDERHPLGTSMSISSPISPNSAANFDNSIHANMETAASSASHGLTRDQVLEKSLEEPPKRRMSDLRHSASLRLHRNSHTRSATSHNLDRVSMISGEAGLHRPVFDSSDDLPSMHHPTADEGLTMRSVSRHRASRSQMSIPGSQSPITISTSPVLTSLGSATAPSSPRRGHRAAAMSVDMGSRNHYTPVTSPRGINNFLCLTAVDKKTDNDSSVQGGDRPITAHRVGVIHETRESCVVVPAAAPAKPVESPVDVLAEQAPVVGSRTRASTGVSSLSSVPSAFGDIGVFDEINGPNSATAAGHNVIAYQSDPSLPALLSGASSVSADLDAEGDDPNATEAISKIYRTTDSMTPPAMAKDRMNRLDSGFLELEPSENIIPVQLDASPPHRPPISSPLNAPLKTSAGELQPSGNEAASLSSHLADSDDDADDSDSDEGLTMTVRRRSRLPESGVHNPRFPPRRRDTNASVCSSDTAKKVDYA